MTQYIGTELEVFSIATRWKSYVRDMLQPYLRGSVLEVGAGMGSFTLALHRSACSRWVCLERDPLLAQEIRRQQGESELPSNLEVVVGTIADLPAPDRFDTILYMDVLEHIADDREEARSAAERLTEGGRIVILSPAFPILFSEFDRAIGHHRRYTRRNLEGIRPPQTATEASFYLDAPGALLSLANRLVLRSARPTVSQISFWDRFVIPLARVFDPVIGYCVGRSVVAIWQKQIAK